MTLISELPETYKKLALLRQEQEIDKEDYGMDWDPDTDDLEIAFDWESTPEGWNFWCDINELQYTTNESYPAIPEESVIAANKYRIKLSLPI